jgi:hypothetical protein
MKGNMCVSMSKGLQLTGGLFVFGLLSNSRKEVRYA